MTFDEISALFQVIVVDLVLAADNAIIVGMVAATVAAESRRRIIMIGIIVAAAMRASLALVTVQLLQIIGMLLAGGLLLLWVCWRLWRDLRAPKDEADNLDSGSGKAPKTTAQAVFQIVIADLSMSLDNVLAVAGVAQHHPVILVIGLTLSVALMAFAASMVARLLERHYWIAYLGLAVILYVSISMIWTGAIEVVQAAS
ncbi:MAG: hypothetical protein CL393_08390 [Acidiferrobacteraceae bacterium]|jgi:YjbE family integral membrane protein|nr:hypothetical protein [Acidiferrobacteraceae bacterium]|tara:strand:+ start:3674 stop:4273 length:600 start_codon:yes stop_codon:yes gene_type:complete